MTDVTVIHQVPLGTFKYSYISHIYLKLISFLQWYIYIIYIYIYEKKNIYEKTQWAL